METEQSVSRGSGAACSSVFPPHRPDGCRRSYLCCRTLVVGRPPKGHMNGSHGRMHHYFLSTSHACLCCVSYCTSKTFVHPKHASADSLTAVILALSTSARCLLWNTAGLWVSQRFEGCSGSEQRTRLFSGRCVHDGEFSVIDSCRRPLQNRLRGRWRLIPQK